MQFIAKIIAVSTENKGKYNMAEVTFKRQDTGKVESKKLMSFVYPLVYDQLSKAVSDSSWSITTEKNEKTTYWDWTAAEPAGASTGTGSAKATNQTSGVSTPARSSYETAEERAKKQVYIVKQSSIAQAVSLLSIGAKHPPSTDLVLKQAQEFVDFVFEDNREKAVNLIDLPNDDVFPD